MACLSDEECSFFVAMNREKILARWSLLGFVFLFSSSALVPYSIFDIYPVEKRHMNYIYFVAYLLLSVPWRRAVLFETAQVCPYGNQSEDLQICKLGYLKKSFMEVVAISVSIVLKFYPRSLLACLAWITFVVELQVHWKLRYGPSDFWMTDVFLGVLMRVIVVCNKNTGLYDLMGMYILCLLIVYHRHVYTPSNAIVSKETDDIQPIEELII